MIAFAGMIVLSLFVPVSFAVEVTSISQNSPTISQYEKYELTFTLDTTYSNPFDTDIIDVTAVITQPDGTQVTAPAFYYREFEVVGSGPEVYRNPGPEQWKIRFAPSIPGSYSFDININEAGVVTTFSDMPTFVCTEGTSRGFVRVDSDDPLCFQYDDGTARNNIGHNVCWVSEELAGCRTYYNNMAAVGENWTRIWMCSWGRDGWVTIEYNSAHGSNNFSGVGTYSLQTSQRLDSVVEAAEELGIGIQLVLQYHGAFSTTTNPDWANNPYNSSRPQDGGFLQNPEDFFSNAEAIRLTKNKYRYIIARWGYSCAIFAWELWNEVQYTDGWSKARPDVVSWHREMAEYISAVDPHGHLVTTSSHSSGFEDIWVIEDIDVVQVHHYGTPVIGSFKTTPHDMGDRYQKPVILGEFGAGSIDGNNSETNVEILGEPYKSQMLEGLVLHNGIWSAFHAKSSSHLWWWDWYIEPYNQYPVFAPLSEYMDGEDLRGMHPAERAVSGFDSYTANPQIGDFYHVHTQTDFYLDGYRFAGMEKLSKFLQGASQSQYRSDPVFHLTMPEAGRLIIQVNQVSAWGNNSLQVRVDSSVVFSSSYQAGASNFTIEVPLGAGDISVQIENTGQDWFNITGYEFAPGQPSLLDSTGLLKEDRALIWVYDINSQYGRTPSGIFSGEALQVRGLADKKYDVNFYATRGMGGVIETQKVESVDGLLSCTIPDFSRDIAVKVTPSCIVGLGDLMSLAFYWLESGEQLIADFNNDDRVDTPELGAVANLWLEDCTVCGRLVCD